MELGWNHTHTFHNHIHNTPTFHSPKDVAQYNLALSFENGEGTLYEVRMSDDTLIACQSNC
ncbi:7462_t:CDS:2 [Funneliformis mosseae]|uniref:7462_t:CDS:1 n=1 Tax=Funneliformis mosseae TaxID=27381 RepID=A0A9N9GBZ1_FUNMO|nr:7462_t:CDS:2 [Funneliformis mosseae]